MRSREERDALVLEHLHIAAQLSSMYARRAGAGFLEDLYSEALVAMIEAAQRWDATKGASYPSFCRLRVMGAIRDYLRGLDHLSRRERAEVNRGERQDPGGEISIDTAGEPGTDRVGLHEVIADRHASDEGDIDFAKRLESVTRGAKALPGHLRAIIEYRLAGMSLAETAEKLGVTESRACQLEPLAIAMLRERLKDL